MSGHPVHHEDDGYVDALRRNAYNNQGVGMSKNLTFICMQFFNTFLFFLDFLIIELTQNLLIDLLRVMIDILV